MVKGVFLYFLIIIRAHENNEDICFSPTNQRQANSI